MDRHKSALIIFMLFLFASCQPKMEDAEDVGLGNLASSEKLGPVVTSQTVEYEHGNHVAQILETTTIDSYSYALIHVKKHGGIALGSYVVLIDEAGVAATVFITKLKNYAQSDVSSLSSGLGYLRLPTWWESSLPSNMNLGANSQVFTTRELIDLSQGKDAGWTWKITQLPKEGKLIGTPPHVVYVPDPEYLGYDKFNFSATDSQNRTAFGSVIIKMNPKVTTLYLSTAGNNGTAIPGNPSYPYKTAQGAVNAALNLVPVKTHPVHISAGSGSFGGVILVDQDLSYISWSGAGAMLTFVGNVYGAGSSGANNVDGKKGPDINIDSNSSLTFGDITSVGGNGGSATLNTTYGGRPGTIKFKGRGGLISSIPGRGTRVGDLACLGQNAGSVIVEDGSYISGVTANGYSCANSGNGGNITAYGQITGDLIAFGGAGTIAGNGGSIWVHGELAGSVYASGLDGSQGGSGGYVGVTGYVLGTIYASGGAGLAGAGGSGGNVVISSGAAVVDVWVQGGAATGTGGNGGTVKITEAVVNDIFADGGATSSGASNAGQGGAVSLYTSGVARIIHLDGGACTSTLGGDGGTLELHTTAFYDSTSSTLAGGVCTMGGTDGSAGTINSL